MKDAERMSSTDLTWLRMDAEGRPMVINCLLMLRGRIDPPLLERSIGQWAPQIPRLLQRSGRRGGAMVWEEDPQFELGRHVTRVSLDGADKTQALQGHISQQASIALDLDHPLWRVQIVEGYGDATPVFARFHHAIGDGPVLVRALLALVDERQTHGLAMTGAVPAAAPRSLAPLGRRLRDAFGIGAEAFRVAAMRPDSPTRFRGERSPRHRVSWSTPTSFDDVRAAARALGCSTSVILTAALAGALRAYLLQRRDPVTSIEVRTILAVALRRPGEEARAGNQFGEVSLDLPLHLETPMERVQALNDRLGAIKRSYAPAMVAAMFKGLAYAPAPVQAKILDRVLSRVTVSISNMRGPAQALHIGGAPIDQLMFWLPLTGALGITVSVMTYDGRVQFGFTTDAASVPDPEELSRFIGREMEGLRSLAAAKVSH